MGPQAKDASGTRPIFKEATSYRPTYVALMFTEKLPETVGVPLIRPVAVLTVRPAGSGVALKEVGFFVAVI